MIVFNNWEITADGSVIARQFDNLTSSITVTGVPPGWEWSMLVSVGENFDIWAMNAEEDGTLSVTLTDDMIPVSGIYTLILRGVQGEHRRHTNKLFVSVPSGLSGDTHWVTLPHEFTEFERRMRELASTSAPTIGENGNWWIGDTDTGVSASPAEGYKVGHGLKVNNGNLEVDTAEDYEGDNTRPITAAAVQNAVGNIEILLETI